GGELHTRELCARDRGKRACHESLGEARVILDQDVAVGQERHQRERQRVSLAHDGALHLVEDRVRVPRDLVQLESLDALTHSRSSLWTNCSNSESVSPGARRSCGRGRSGRTTSHSSSPSSALARCGSESRRTPSRRSSGSAISRNKGLTRTCTSPADWRPAPTTRSIRCSASGREAE